MEKNYFQLYQKYKNKYISLKSKMNNQQVGGGDTEKKDVFLFKAEWCPHCKNFMTQWKKLEADHGSKYNFITYDSEKNSKEIEDWPIQGYPTIMVKKGKDVMEYAGPNEYKSVLNFIKNI